MIEAFDGTDGEDTLILRVSPTSGSEEYDGAVSQKRLKVIGSALVAWPVAESCRTAVLFPVALTGG